LALTELGRCDEGVALVGENVDAYKATGNRLDANLYLGALAHAQGRAGHLEEAFVTVEEALSAAPDQEVNQPYVIWVRGELHLKTGARELAETDFREAIAYARRIGAKLFELRAALSLGRLLKSRGHIAEARNLLVPLCAGFTEGFDVPDLKDARALLDELNLAP